MMPLGSVKTKRLRFGGIVSGLVFSLLLVCSASSGASSIPESKRSIKAVKKHSPKLSKQLQAKGLSLGDPIFIRIIKSTDDTTSKGYLEVFVETETGAFQHFKSWDICTWSGELGPKIKQGDGQSPEGFYFIRPSQLNPRSSYHLSFNLGYPNAYDRAHGRTGDFLMVHGNCVSIGCYAMTDNGIEEIYTLVQKSFENGQKFIRVHSFPFEMTEANMARYQDSQHIAFWKNLRRGWLWFEAYKRPPNVTVRYKTYQFGES